MNNNDMTGHVGRGDAVRQVQTIVRDLTYWLDGKPAVAVDGNYDDGTRRAVADLQRRYGLPATGEVDRATWRLLHELHALYSEYYGDAACIKPFPKDGEREISPDERSSLVLILQILMNELCTTRDDLCAVKPSGTYDAATETAVRSFQKSVNLPVTGTVDKLTWNRIVGEYNALVKLLEK